LTDENKTKFIAAITEHLRFVAALSVSLSLLGTIIWWAFGPRIEENARILVGTDELKEIVIQQGVRLDQNVEALNGLSERITAMEPSPAVAEYDILRSSIDETCIAGQVCRYTYRVRRTDEGSSCGVPSAQRVLIDASGTTHFPQLPSNAPRATRLSDEWSIVSSSFVVPRRVVPGVAEFSLQITYPDCDRDILGRVVVVEESPHLIFIIGRSE